MKKEAKENKEYFVPLPDNEAAFYAFVNLIINNRDNQHKPDNCLGKPKHFGPVKDFKSANNEVGERFLITYNLKDHRFLEMLKDQFTLIRTYFNRIEDFVAYPNSDIYSLN